MTMRFLGRGATALACAAVVSTAFLAPATAAPAITFGHGLGALSSAALSSAVLQPFALLPFSPAIPSESDIAKAKKSESATAAASAQLDGIISTANESLQASTLIAMGANSEYTNALVILEQRTAWAETTQAKADAAAGAHKQAKAQLGQLAGSLYKNGGLDLSIQNFLASSDADNAIYQASTLMALSANRAHTFDTAEAAAATSTSLEAQAKEARKAANNASVAAAASRGQAQNAADAQSAVVANNQAQREVLLQRLASLHNTTVTLEAARVDEAARQAQEEALKQQIDSSNHAPEPIKPPLTKQRPPVNAPAPQPENQMPPAAVLPGTPKPPPTPAPARPAPPIAQAPKPSAPSAQQPAPAAPAPVAPVAPAPVQPAPVAPVAPAAPVQPAPVAPPVVSPPPVTPAPPTGSSTQVMVDYAMSKIGGPYQWGGTGPAAFDCSGLVQQAFAAAGKSVPRQGTDQFWAAPQRVPLAQMQYGDLLVFDDDGTGRFGHIAIYIGNNQVVQALNYSQPIAVTSLSWMSTMKLYPYAARY